MSITHQNPVVFRISANDRILQLAFLGIIVTAFVSLVARIGNYPIYPPYIPLGFASFAAGLFWLGRLKIKHPGPDTFFVLFISLLPMIFSLMSENPAAARANASVFLYFGALYWLTKMLVRKRTMTLKRTIKYFSAIFYILCFIGLLQVATGTPVGLVARYFGGNSVEGALFQDSFRVSSTLTSPNVFALTISFLLPLVIWRQARHGRKFSFLLTVGMTAIVATILVFASGSRAGMIFLTMSALFSYFFWLKVDKRIKNKWITTLIILISAIVVGAALLGGEMATRLALKDDPGRLSMYLAAINLLRNPEIFFFGSGSGQFFGELFNKGISVDYRSWIDLRDLNSTVHNWMLQILSENGIFTFLAWLGFIGFIARKTIFLKRLGENKVYVVLGYNVLFLFAIPLQFDTSLNNPSVLTLIAVASALVNQRAAEMSRLQGPLA